MMFQQGIPNKKPQRDERDCEIDIKKSKNGSTKIKFRGNCTKSHLEMAKAEAKGLSEGEERSLEDF
jgi:hypothetical protein